MVLYDDKKWMCRLIRTAFTLEDDSGACEHVLKLRPYLGDNQGEDSDSFSSDDSYDVREALDAMGRRRSNTAIKLGKMELKRKVQQETQHVRVNPNDSGKNELVFTRDNSYLKNNERLANKTVSVTKLLETVPHPSRVPYAEYARFEASAEPTVACKRYEVYVPFLPPRHRNYPIRVAVLATAKVVDFIGLLLWMIAHTYPSVKLYPVHHYMIQIADDEGEWEDDFPEMDNNELISKFMFPQLALLPLKTIPDAPVKTKLGLSFLLPSGNTFQIIVEDIDLTIGQLIRLVLSKSGWESSSISSKSAKVSYHLEKLGDPNTTYTDMSLQISQCKCKEFCLVRDGARSIQNDIGKLDSQHGKSSSGATESPSRSDLYPVMVSTGRFNKLKNALCVIWGGDRMDLEFQSKTKSYPLSSISGVKLDAARMRVVVSVTQVSSTGVGSHYLTSTAHLTMITSELRIATELYHHLNSILTTKTK